MNLFAMFEGFSYTVIQGADVAVRRLEIDSRLVTKGACFFAITGFKQDGHQYIQKVAEGGGVAIVAENKEAIPANLPKHVTVLLVTNSRVALAHAAAAFYGHPENSFLLAGVTGTNGKTSVTYFINAILEKWCKKVGVIGTVGARVASQPIQIHTATSTTPDTIQLYQMFQKMQEQKVDYTVMEVTSHALALEKVRGLSFKVGLFTNLTQDHLDMHGTMENYKETKAKFFAQCETAVLNGDDPAAKDMAKQAKGQCYTYSFHSPSDFQGKNMQFTQESITFDVTLPKPFAQTEGQTITVSVPVPGEFMAYNALASLVGCLVLGVPVATILEGLSTFQGVPGRIQQIPNKLGIGVFVDYAHTPDGLVNVLNAVRGFTKGKVIAVFGCGGDRDKTKRPIMGKIGGEKADVCFLTSDNPRSENPMAILEQVAEGTKQTNCPFKIIEDRKEAIFEAIKSAKAGDSVVICGKGHETYQIFATQTIDFDDTLVAEEGIQLLSK